MVKVIKVTRDRAGLHIFLDRAVVKVRVKDAEGWKSYGPRSHSGKEDGKFYVTFNGTWKKDFDTKEAAEAYIAKQATKDAGHIRDAASWYVKLRKDAREWNVLINANSEAGAEREAERQNPGAKVLSIESYGGAVRKISDAGHMPTARGTQRGIPAKTAEDLRALHGAIRTHKDDCSCAACKGKKTSDATYFSQGDTVTALVTAQGLTNGQKYKVKFVNSNRILGSNYVLYGVEGSDGKSLNISNGHMLFSKDSTHPSVMIATIEEQIRKKRYETPAELEDLKRQLAAEKEKLKKTGPLKDGKPCSCK